MSLYFKIKKNLFPVNDGFPDFVPQFRLEGRSRDGKDAGGLEMRIADPLWMLGRQWQFGEFKGEDNGSPISIRTNYRKEKTTHYSFPNANQQQALGNVPLETRVEAIEVEPKDLRSKVRIGQKFEALITTHFPQQEAADFIRLFRLLYPLSGGEELDNKSKRFFNLMSGKVIDGGRLWEGIQENNFPPNDNAGLKEVVEQLKTWYRQLFVASGKQSAWNSQQLLHQFSVHGQNDIELNAPDYQSGHLDWYSFDKAKSTINPTEQANNSEPFIPVNVSFAAMPEKRLFSFEDSQLDLAGMEVEQTDLVRLMIIDFSLVSGNNWFIIPVEMGLGELCWINHLEVKDVFGVHTIIKNEATNTDFLGNDPLKIWDVFKIRDQALQSYKAAEHFMYLAPATTFRQESPPLEELLFLRDEYANMVWGIEKTVCNGMGQPTNGYDLHLELNGPFLREDKAIERRADGVVLPKFRLASPVPTNWIPYLPEHIAGSNTDIELHRAVMMRNETDVAPKDIEPLSRLAQKDLLTIREEAIPRAGVRVQLTRQRIRWTDGKTYIWLGRKVLAGKGEGSSGLTFDQLLV